MYPSDAQTRRSNSMVARLIAHRFRLRPALLVLLVVTLASGAGAWGASATIAHGPSEVSPPVATTHAAPPSAPAGAPLVRPSSATSYTPHATSRVYPSATAVDPFAYFSKEPAPMGIADFGVGANGVPYRYTTPEFEGTLDLVSDHAYTYYSSSGYTYQSNDVTFQLNVVLLLHDRTQSMQFWVQDVLFLNSTAHAALFGNNIWNFSTGSGGLVQSNSVVGNGSYYGGVYEDLAQNGYAGSNVTLRYPVNVTTRVIASTIAGVPHVGLAYDDGSGFVTYDNVTFPWASGWTVDGFVVDGTSYNPIGLYDDAEWDYDGPGNGLSSENIASNLTLGLDFWNGHNLQAVPNAYDFGSDTAETTSNVVPSLAGPSAGPTPFVHLGNGSGALGMLYNRSTVSVVNVSSPAANGTLLVDGSPVAFVGGHLNLTLAPGNHSLELRNDSGSFGSLAVALTPGEYLPVAFQPRPLPQLLTVRETGLPAGTMFDVVVDGGFNASATGSVQFALLNGSYAYSVAPIAGWELGAAYTGTVTVSGPTLLTFAWHLATFPVTSLAQNLPANVAWTITIGGIPHVGGAAPFPLPNGTYDYQVSVGILYLAQPDNGTFTIQGAGTVVAVQFGLDPGTLVGSVDPSNATVTVGGTAVAVSGGLFSVTVVPGVYPVVVAAPGWNTTFRNVTITAGNTTLESFALGPAAPTGSHHSGGSGSPGSGGASAGLTGIELAALVVVAALAVAGVVAGAAWRARVHRAPRRRTERPARR